MTAPIISISHVTKRFDAVVALDDVSFELTAGQFHAIVGENGAGKSTLMKILAGVITDFEGEYLLRGEPTNFRGTRDAEHRGVAIIHQELNLVEQLSAAANVFLGRELRTSIGLLDDRAMQREAQRLLTQLECHIDPCTPAGSLRVGDQQLIEIAKALSLKTDILIMDEPTSALTETEVERLFRVVDRLKAQGVTILYISHKMDEVFRLADTVTVLRDGRLIAQRPRSEVTPRDITQLMVGRELEQTHLGAGRSIGETVLDVRKLSLPWTGHARAWRLRDISFALRAGEIVGIAGLMGAGRTELLECLFGASNEQPIGDILLAGNAVKFTHPSQAKEAGIALVTEDRKRLGLFSHLNVRENITMCTLGESAVAGLIRYTNEQRRAQGSIEQLRVKTAGPEAAITSLSGGNQQKTIIGRWLLTNPRVLLLDDPTRGIDVGAKAEIYRLMDELCRTGLAIIVTSSELPELLTVSDRILVLCEGRLTGEFSRAEATEHRIMEAATNRQTGAA